MLRKFKIKTRLLITFFIVAFFTLTVGLTGFVSLTSIGNFAVKTIDNVSILNDIYDHHIAIDAGVFSMIYVSDITLTNYVVQTTKVHTEGLLTQLNEYLEFQDQFNDVFTPGEMQDMANLFEICKETYVPVLNEVFDLVELGRQEEALSVYVNRLTPIYDTVSYYIDMGFAKNLDYSVTEISRNSENASFNAYLMLAIVLLSLIVSVIMALAVTKSIAIPLSGLGAAAEKVANGELDVHFEQSQSNDEIAHLSLKLKETMQYLNKAQQLQLEAVEARHEKEKAEESARSKGNFLAKMSHEIRTPMNAIIGMAELALREDMPNTAREHILTIKQAGANLLSIINDILDFSKIESGKLEIIPANYLFSSLMDDVISIIRMRVIDSEIRFIVNIDSDIPNVLFGDEIRIRQILLNILSNAVKFTEKGFVSLTIKGKIRKFPSKTKDIVDLTIEVADSGKGIKQEDVAKLFGDFVQIDLDSNKGIEGTGLGLVIARSFVQAMGGDIIIDSEYGKGSTFTITLPQGICEYGKLASVSNPGEKYVLVYELREIYSKSLVYTIANLGVKYTIVESDSSFCEKIAGGKYSFVLIASNLYQSVRDICSKFESKVKIVLLAEFGEAVVDQNLSILTMPIYSIPVANVLNGLTTSSTFSANKGAVVRFTAPEARILVVDDINTNLKVAEGLLLPYKMQVELKNSGLGAIEAIKSKKFDLVFMDHMMPEMDGVEATAAIRALEGEHFKTLPVIALTANVVLGMKEMFIERGFNDFLAKPIDISKLDETLDRWIPKEKREWDIEKKDRRSKNRKNDSDVSLQPLVIPGVNVQYGITMTGGTLTLYRQVLALFRKDAEKRLPMFQTMPDAETLSSFVTQVHALKSASASLGAAEISALAAELETAGKAGDLAFIRKNLSGFTRQLAELVEGIRAWETSIKESDSSEDGANPAAALPLLRELASALEAQKTDDIDRILEELNQRPPDPKIREALEQISEQVLVSEFDEAGKIVHSILEGG